MRFLFALVFATCVVADVSPTSALQPARPGQASFVSRAVYADGRLWLLSDAGELSSVAIGSCNRVHVALSSPVLDICSKAGQLAVLSGKPGDRNRSDSLCAPRAARTRLRGSHKPVLFQPVRLG